MQVVFVDFAHEKSCSFVWWNEKRPKVSLHKEINAKGVKTFRIYFENAIDICCIDSYNKGQ